MKTKIKKIMLTAIMVFTLTNLALTQLMASPYQIFNNKPCDVEIHYRVFDAVGGVCMGQCAANNVIIPSNSFINIACVVPNRSDIEIIVIGLGGSLLSTSQFLNFGAGATGGGNWNCYTMGQQSYSGALPAPAVIPCGSSVWSIVVGPFDIQIN